MKKLAIAVTLLLIFQTAVIAQNCWETAKEVAPPLSEETRRQFTERAMAAQAMLEANRNDPDRVIWYGRRTAYLGNYKHSINIFTGGIEKFPKDARFYRHRGHRLITLRCFDDAVKDFETAAKLIKGKPDDIEPDGLPNARNIPTSTLQSNIFYHLGLAYYLKGNFKKALKAYRNCEKVSQNPDMLVATKHWLYMTLRRLGKVKEANK
jgi:tetratricopeptide (TPR) repeat protein